MYLFVGEGFECDVGGDGEAMLVGSGQQTDARCDLMGAAAEQSEHSDGIGLIDGFAEDLVAHDDYGIGGDNQFVGLHHGAISIGLLASNIKGYVGHRQVGGIRLVDILQHPDFEGQSQPR